MFQEVVWQWKEELKTIASPKLVKYVKEIHLANGEYFPPSSIFSIFFFVCIEHLNISAQRKFF